ncbi:MAG: proteasome subunit alpha [Armatimonadetes bacterium]|nr:proteasome subunit alpha [Armatimonadota bacterium]
MSGDFRQLLEKNGHSLTASLPELKSGAPVPALDTQGTTVLAIKYRGGVLNVGDRRATAATAIMYDRAEKVFALDDHTLISVAGSYARALEVVKYLQHSFKYYSRTQLQPMSLDGKLSEVSRVLVGNLTAALQGIGLFIPILSAYDPAPEGGRIFLYDGMGARFEAEEFGAAGSGSERIRGSFDYILKTKGRFRDRPLEESLQEALVLLDIAADLDSATSGLSKIPPMARTVSAQGVQTLSEEMIRSAIERARGRLEA